jgi:hypothetical protein
MHQDTANGVRTETTGFVPPAIDVGGDPDTVSLMDPITVSLIGDSKAEGQHGVVSAAKKLCPFIRIDEAANRSGWGVAPCHASGGGHNLSLIEKIRRDP